MGKGRICSSVTVIALAAFGLLPLAAQEQEQDQDQVLVFRKVLKPASFSDSGTNIPTPTPSPSSPEPTPTPSSPAPAPTPTPTPTPSPTPSSPEPTLTPSFIYGAWGEFDNNCGSGTRTRTFECVGVDISNNMISMPADFCVSLGDPIVSETANVRSGCFWNSGEWSEWSNSCGVGTRTRSVECASGSGGTITPVPFSFCSGLGSPPPSSETEEVRSGCVTLINPYFESNLQGWTTSAVSWNSGAASFNGSSAAHLAATLSQNFTTFPGTSYRVTIRYRITSSNCTRSGIAPFAIFAANGQTTISSYYSAPQILCNSPSIETFSTVFTANHTEARILLTFRSNSGQTVFGRVEDVVVDIL